MSINMHTAITVNTAFSDWASSPLPVNQVTRPEIARAMNDATTRSEIDHIYTIAAALNATYVPYANHLYDFSMLGHALTADLFAASLPSTHLVQVHLDLGCGTRMTTRVVIMIIASRGTLTGLAVVNAVKPMLNLTFDRIVRRLLPHAELRAMTRRSLGKEDPLPVDEFIQEEQNDANRRRIETSAEDRAKFFKVQESMNTHTIWKSTRPTLDSSILRKAQSATVGKQAVMRRATVKQTEVVE